MSRTIRAAVAAGAFSITMLAAPGTAYASHDGTPWGQEVSQCNADSCYQQGQSRGEYVSGQAKDDDKPGYGQEIHGLANPGHADPKSKRF